MNFFQVRSKKPKKHAWFDLPYHTIQPLYEKAFVDFYVCNKFAASLAKNYDYSTDIIISRMTWSASKTFCTYLIWRLSQSFPSTQSENPLSFIYRSHWHTSQSFLCHSYNFFPSSAPFSHQDDMRLWMLFLHISSWLLQPILEHSGVCDSEYKRRTQHGQSIFQS